jgi:hypothetical protein
MYFKEVREFLRVLIQIKINFFGGLIGFRRKKAEKHRQ